MKWVRALFSSIASYVKRSGAEASLWFHAGSTFWVWLALTIIICLAFYVVPGHLPDRVRWAGTLFEFLGVGAVVIGINRARRSFGRPGVFQGALIWIGGLRFIFFRRPPITASVNVNLESVSAVRVDATVISAPKSTDERIVQLEKGVTELRTSIGNVQQKLDQQRQELRAELDNEAAARQAGDQGVRKKLEEGMIGDSTFEVAGVVYVCLGLIMSHLSEEIALGLKFIGAT